MDHEEQAGIVGSLREPLLSTLRGTPSDGEIVDNGDNNLVAHQATTPSSPLLSGNLEASPSRSFLETSFYDHVKHLMQGLGPDDEDDDDQEHLPVQEDNDDDNLPRILHCWNRFISRFHSILLILTVFVVWPIGFFSFEAFHQHTDSTFNPLPGTPSQAAQDAFASAYGGHDWQDPMNPPLILVLKATNETLSLIDPEQEAYRTAETFTFNISSALREHLAATPMCRGSRSISFYASEQTMSSSNSTGQNETASWSLQVTSYYSLEKEGLGLLARSLVADGGLMTIMQIQYIPPDSWRGDAKACMFALLDAIESYSIQYAPPEFFSVEFTGIHWFQRDLIRATRADIHRMDMVALPLALFLLGVVLPHANSCFVWLVPLVTMVSTVATWSIVMRFLVQYMQITQFTPTVMMSLTIGMGIDYTLFLLVRYTKHSFQNGPSHRRQSIARMLWQGGTVVTWSGLTLLCNFLGLMLLPLSMLQSVGVGAAVAIASALIVNLTLVPALLNTRLGKSIVKTRDDDDSHGMIDSTRALLSEDDNATNQNSAGGNDEVLQHIENLPSLWYRVSRHLLHPYKGMIVILILLQILVPVGMKSARVQSSLSFDLLLPADSPSLETYHELSSLFGEGRLHPYRILFDGRNANMTMTSPKGFATMNKVLKQLRSIDDDDAEISVRGDLTSDNSEFTTRIGVQNGISWLGLFEEKVDVLMRQINTPMPALDSDATKLQQQQGTVYSGISMLENEPIPNYVYVAAKLCSQIEPHCPVELLHVIDDMDRSVTSHDMRSTFVTATLGVNPFSREGLAWLEQARVMIAQLGEQKALHGVQVHIQGLPAIEYDAKNAVYNMFPKMIMGTAFVVFILIGLFFRSLFTPLRSVISIGLTLGFSFGLGIMVYQDGILDWVQLRPFDPIDGGFCWLVPVMAFSIIVGLALDYDVFLISSILEFRQDGVEHKASIAAGLHCTGSVITAAGGIMALAFGSLMLSTSPVLYQWSFLLTSAVLLDTFVVRTVVVPVVTNLAGQYCWWPRKLPEPRFFMNCFHERQHSDDLRSLLHSLEETSEYEPIAPRSSWRQRRDQLSSW